MGGGGEEEGGRRGGNKGCYSHTCDPRTDTYCVVPGSLHGSRRIVRPTPPFQRSYPFRGLSRRPTGAHRHRGGG